MVIPRARCSGTHPQSLRIFQSKAMFSLQKNISAQNTLTIMSQEQSNCPKISITSLATLEAQCVIVFIAATVSDYL
jgi:hypothetical protein